MTLTVYREMLQGSDEWHAARRGLLTASTIASLITTKPPAPSDYACPQCKADRGEDCWSMAAKKEPVHIKTPHPPRVARATENPDGLPDRIALADASTIDTAALRLAAERVTVAEDPELRGVDIERGHQVEPIARAWYAETRGVEVEQVGLMVLDFDGIQLGYSPDGLVGNDGCIEVKAPRSKRHVLNHIEGIVPAEHMAQVQTGLYVAGRSWCDFISYLGGSPPFVTRALADPTWFAAIEAAVEVVEARTVEIVHAYETATAGLATTLPLPDPYDVELKLA